MSFGEEIRFVQFLLMFRTVEHVRYQNNFAKIKHFFNENCDLVILKKGNQQELSLSFGKMASICMENGFFSHERQKAFAKDVDERVKTSGFLNFMRDLFILNRIILKRKKT